MQEMLTRTITIHVTKLANKWKIAIVKSDKTKKGDTYFKI